jgi:dipeptidyl aminopeptidase/acylaminoacyl peptidase
MWIRSSLLLLVLSAAHSVYAQMEEEEEHYFMRARVIVRVLNPDTLAVEFGAGAEDMVNTVGIAPYDNSDPQVFRLYETRAEAYLQDRLPVYVDGKRVYLKVSQWKPEGKGRADGFDSLSVYSPIRITLTGKLPTPRKTLEVSTNIWTERFDAGATEVEYRLYDGNALLKRFWSKREKKQRLPISADSLAVLGKNPLPPVTMELEEDED